MQKHLWPALILVVIAIGGGYWYMNNSEELISPSEDTSRTVDMYGQNSEGKYEVTAQSVNYYDDVVGYFAEPREHGQYPGVVMIHEWWGLNDHIKKMAENLASEGYNVLAVDLHHGEVATTPDRARQLVSSLDQQDTQANMKSAVQYLLDNYSRGIASLGWCFGGGQSLQLAMNTDGLDATVIYYGSLVTSTDKLSDIDWPVLGIFGAEDSSIPVETVRAFEESLADVGVEHSIHIYPGVGHAFANPSGQNYAPDESMDAWKKTLEFLAENLKT